MYDESMYEEDEIKDLVSAGGLASAFGRELIGTDSVIRDQAVASCALSALFVSYSAG